MTAKGMETDCYLWVFFLLLLFEETVVLKLQKKAGEEGRNFN